MSEENQNQDFDNVTLEAAQDACRAADEAADERDSVAVEWADVIESSVAALSLDSFQGRVGEKFTIEVATKTLELELEKVETMAPAAALGDGAPGAREHFAVTFKEDDPSISLSDGIYRLEHAELEAFEVYLEEVKAPNADGSEAKEQHYEVVFS